MRKDRLRQQARGVFNRIRNGTRRKRLIVVRINDNAEHLSTANLLSVRGKPVAERWLSCGDSIVGVYSPGVAWDDFMADLEAAMDERERLDMLWTVNEPRGTCADRWAERFSLRR